MNTISAAVMNELHKFTRPEAKFSHLNKGRVVLEIGKINK
jgi:hypothetical protein